MLCLSDHDQAQVCLPWGLNMAEKGLRKGPKVPMFLHIKTVVFGLEGSETYISEMYNVDSSALLCVM